MNPLTVMHGTMKTMSARGTAAAGGMAMVGGLVTHHEFKKHGAEHPLLDSTVAGKLGSVALAGGGTAYANKYGAKEGFFAVPAGGLGTYVSGREGNVVGRALQKTFTHGASIASIKNTLQDLATSNGGGNAVDAWNVVKGML